MTPAQILNLAYAGLATASTAHGANEQAQNAVCLKQKLLQGTGWRAGIRRGAEPPPAGSILLGAVLCRQEGECDFNIYAWPETADAMRLRERAFEEKPPTGTGIIGMTGNRAGGSIQGSVEPRR